MLRNSFNLRIADLPPHLLPAGSRDVVIVVHAAGAVALVGAHDFGVRAEVEDGVVAEVGASIADHHLRKDDDVTERSITVTIGKFGEVVLVGCFWYHRFCILIPCPPTGIEGKRNGDGVVIVIVCARSPVGTAPAASVAALVLA